MTALLTETTSDLTTRLGEELKQSPGDRPSRTALRDLAGAANALTELTLAAWNWVFETLQEDGFEGQELARHCRAVLSGIEGSLAAYERLRSWAAAEIRLQEMETRLPALREASSHAAAVLGLADRPPRPVDEAKLTESRAALERGEFVAADDSYLARLAAGEDF